MHLPEPDYSELLADARARTLRVIEPLTNDALHRQHTPIMSPLVWDLAHIAAYEDLWLAHRAGGLELLRPDIAELYDAFETPRSKRGDLPLLRAEEALSYMAAVRERVLEVLERVDLSPGSDRLNAGGFVWEMVVQHEHQHNETMIQTLKLAEPGTFAPERPLAGIEAAPADGEMVLVEGGRVTNGAPAERFAYDNERPLHEVEIDAFMIDRTPVTNGAYLEFVEAGGYSRPELWDPEGWAWRTSEAIERPLYWTEDGRLRDFERTEPLDPAMPVAHLSWYEADAFARWRGDRLPTEAEWETAATWDAGAGGARRLPWGEGPEPGLPHANVDQLSFGTAPAGSLPEGASPCGALGMIGDLWEWTASEFDGYAGFEAFPYREYSEVFFRSGYRALRGGSWATRPRVATATFRNWDLPVRRQILSGFRCARDA